jgi:hypothetical protein
MLRMLRRHEAEILLKAGHAKTEVARLAAGCRTCQNFRNWRAGISGNPHQATANAEPWQPLVSRPLTTFVGTIWTLRIWIGNIWSRVAIVLALARDRGPY